MNEDNAVESLDMSTVATQGSVHILEVSIFGVYNYCQTSRRNIRVHPRDELVFMITSRTCSVSVYGGGTCT